MFYDNEHPFGMCSNVHSSLHGIFSNTDAFLH